MISSRPATFVDRSKGGSHHLCIQYGLIYYYWNGSTLCSCCPCTTSVSYPMPTTTFCPVPTTYYAPCAYGPMMSKPHYPFANKFVSSSQAPQHGISQASEHGSIRILTKKKATNAIPAHVSALQESLPFAATVDPEDSQCHEDHIPPELSQVGDVQAEPKSNSDNEANAEPKSNSDGGGNLKSDSEPKAESDDESESEVKAVPKAEANNDPQSDSDDAESNLKIEHAVEPNAAPAREAKVKIQSQLKARTNPKFKSTAKSNGKSNSKSNSKSKAKSNGNSKSIATLASKELKGDVNPVSANLPEVQKSLEPTSNPSSAATAKVRRKKTVKKSKPKDHFVEDADMKLLNDAVEEVKLQRLAYNVLSAQTHCIQLAVILLGHGNLRPYVSSFFRKVSMFLGVEDEERITELYRSIPFNCMNRFNRLYKAVHQEALDFERFVYLAKGCNLFCAKEYQFSDVNVLLQEVRKFCWTVVDALNGLETLRIEDKGSLAKEENYDKLFRQVIVMSAELEKNHRWRMEFAKEHPLRKELTQLSFTPLNLDVYWPLPRTFTNPLHQLNIVRNLTWGINAKTECLKCNKKASLCIVVPCCLTEQVLCCCSMNKNTPYDEAIHECLNISSPACVGTKHKLSEITLDKTQEDLRNQLEAKRLTRIAQLFVDFGTTK